MTLQGIVMLNFIALVLLLWILNLVRKARLYVGYGLMFILILLTVMATISIPGLLAAVTSWVGYLFPTSALTVIALSFLTFLLIYVLTQLTIISNRLATLVQEIAIRNVRAEDEFLSPKRDDALTQNFR